MRRGSRQYKEYMKQYSKKYRLAHSVEIKAGQVEWVKEHREQTTARQRAWDKKHPDRVKQNQDNWAAKNPDKKARIQRRGSWMFHYQLTESDVMGMLVRQRGHCNGCGSGISLMTGTPDHVIARIDGGTNALSNFQLLCFPCNTAKHTWSMADFVRLAHRIAAHHPNGWVGDFAEDFSTRDKERSGAPR